MEIERLHKMLLDAGIEHEWRDRTPGGYGRLRRRAPDLFAEEPKWGWQIVIHYPDGEQMISAIEGRSTYGVESDRIEIMGLLTPEEEEYGSVAGWLTAEDVFQRIVRVVNASD